MLTILITSPFFISEETTICNLLFDYINGIEYDKSRLIEFDKKELKACILRFETELKILKDL